MARLEQALADVRVLKERWAASSERELSTPELDAAFSEALARFPEQARVLALDVAELTGYTHAFERTLSWLGSIRRLSKEYEQLCETSEALIYAIMTCLMVRRLART